jgi:hypothetical protein
MDLVASLFSVKLKSAKGLKKIVETSNFQACLAQCKKVAPTNFVDVLKRYQLHLNHTQSHSLSHVTNCDIVCAPPVRRETATSDDMPKPFMPTNPMEDLFPGTFYLD